MFEFNRRYAPRLEFLYKRITDLAARHGGRAPLAELSPLEGETLPEMHRNLRALAVLGAVVLEDNGSPIDLPGMAPETRHRWYLERHEPLADTVRPTGDSGRLRASILCAMRTTPPRRGIDGPVTDVDELRERVRADSAQVDNELLALAAMKILDLVPEGERLIPGTSSEQADVLMTPEGTRVSSVSLRSTLGRDLEPVNPWRIGRLRKLFAEPGAEGAFPELHRAAASPANDFPGAFKREVLEKPGGIAFMGCLEGSDRAVICVWATGEGSSATLSFLKTGEWDLVGLATTTLAAAIDALIRLRGKKEFVVETAGVPDIERVHWLLERLGFDDQGNGTWTCSVSSFEEARARWLPGD
jgi:hypothetical protein